MILYIYNLNITYTRIHSLPIAALVEKIIYTSRNYIDDLDFFYDGVKVHL